MSTINATGNDFENVVLKSKIPVLVDFWAPWCGPCRMMAPILDEYAEEMKGKVSVVKVDVDEHNNQNLAMQYQIRSIPNMKLFKNGSVVHDIVGLRQKSELAKEISKFI